MPFTLPLARRIAAWNHLVPKRAVAVNYEPGVSLRYRHATKGWRSISGKRLAILGL